MVRVSKIRFRARLGFCKIRVGVVVPLYQLSNPKHHNTDPIRNHNHITDPKV